MAIAAAAVMTGGAAAAGAAILGSSASTALTMMVGAAIIAIATTAATTFSIGTINGLLNGKDPFEATYKAQQKVFSKEGAKQMVVSGTSAALTAGLTQGIGAGAEKAGLSAQSGSQGASFMARTGAAINQTMSSATANYIITGKSLDFSDILKQTAVNVAGSYSANKIGSMKYQNQINTTEQLLLHAGLGYAMGEVGYGNGLAGAAGGVIGELTAMTYAESQLNKGNYDIDDIKKTSIALAEVTGAAVGGLVSGEVDGVNAGFATANNAIDNNYLLPKEKGELVKKIKECSQYSSKIKSRAS